MEADKRGRRRSNDGQRRIRRRKKLIFFYVTRTLVILGMAAVLILLIYGIVRGIKGLSGSGGQKEKKTHKATETSAPREDFSSVTVPAGYEEVFEQLKEKYEEYPEMDYVIYNMEQYPIKLLELLAHNTETLDFVKGYPDHENDKEAGAIEAGEVKEGEIPLFLQWDERWGYLEYGNNIIALNGCGPTCLSMVVVGLTGNREMTPKAIADFSIEHDYFDESEGTEWVLFSEGAGQLGVTPKSVSLDKDAMIAELEAGHPLICSVGEGDFTTEGHFIVITKVTKKGKFVVRDPNSRKNSEKKWESDKVIKQIRGLWSFQANE